MAEAEVKSVVVVPEVREDTIVLTLTKYEAMVIFAVTGRIGGTGKQRRAADRVYWALRDTLPDTDDFWRPDHELYTSGGPLRFENKPEFEDKPE